MAGDKTPDKFAAIIDYCHYSSSQDEILTQSKFAREVEVDSGEGAKSTVEGKSGGSREKSKEGDENKERESGEFVAICADCEERENLGFRKRSLIDGGFDGKVKLNEGIEVGSGGFGEKERESPLKKSRVSMNSEEIETARVVRSHLKVQVVSPLNRVVLESGQCSEKLGSEVGNEERGETCVEKLGSEGRNADQVEACAEKLGSESGNEKQVAMCVADSAKKKREFEGVDGNGEENQDDDHVEKTSHSETREGDLNASDEGKGGFSHGTKKQRKRELPRSLLGHVWGTTVEGDERGRNGVDASAIRKDDLDEAKDDGNEKVKSKSDRTIRNLVDVLKIFAIESRYAENFEIDIFETAKRRGMTFPQSRFRKDIN